MNKKIAIPVSIVFAAFLVQLFTFSSSCGCLDPDEEFASYIYLNNPSEIAPNAVQSGFERHFPRGAFFASKDLLKLSEDGENVFEKKANSLVCTYYYEHSQFAKRGYRVVIEFENNGKIIGVKTAKLSSWFGIEVGTL